MTPNTQLLYDGTIDGFFSAIFSSYLKGYEQAKIYKEDNFQPSLFDNTVFVTTQIQHAKRVQAGLVKKIGLNQLLKIIKVWHSHLPETEIILMIYIKGVINGRISVKDSRNENVLRVNQINKMMGREIHRMHAFVRFQLTADGIYAATISPDFDVIPFIGRHFKDRYADQKWIIYDSKRGYGIFFDTKQVNYIELENPKLVGTGKIDPNILESSELDFQQLWKEYFHATCITERKNLKLHLRHVPYRYWKYLPEKYMI